MPLAAKASERMYEKDGGRQSHALSCFGRPTPANANQKRPLTRPSAVVLLVFSLPWSISICKLQHPQSTNFSDYFARLLCVPLLLRCPHFYNPFYQARIICRHHCVCAGKNNTVFTQWQFFRNFPIASYVQSQPGARCAGTLVLMELKFIILFCVASHTFP